MSRRVGSISATLRARRALLLAEGRRRFYVFPLDVGPHSRLGKIPHGSPSDCVAAAHAWLQRVKDADSWWFTIVERAELNGQSVHAGVQDILVFNDLLPIGRRPPGSEARGDAIREAARSACRAGASGAAPQAGTFKATNGSGVPCRRRQVPQYA